MPPSSSCQCQAGSFDGICFRLKETAKKGAPGTKLPPAHSPPPGSVPRCGGGGGWGWAGAGDAVHLPPCSWAGTQPGLGARALRPGQIEATLCLCFESEARRALSRSVCQLLSGRLLRSFKLLKIIQSTRNGLQSNASFHCIKQPS